MSEKEPRREEKSEVEHAIDEIDAEMQSLRTVGQMPGISKEQMMSLIEINVDYEGSENYRGVEGLGSVTLHVKEREDVSDANRPLGARGLINAAIFGSAYKEFISILAAKLAKRGYRLGTHNGLGGFETFEVQGHDAQADSWYIENLS